MTRSNNGVTTVPKIFLINGPAGSGKDTAAIYLSKKYGRLMKFAEPIKAAATALYHGGNREEFDEFDTFERKGKRRDIYFGKSCREVQIGISEEFLKPFHGSKQIFGAILANQIEKLLKFTKEPSPKFFISDSGFRDEAIALIERFGAGNICLFRLYRPGHTFEGDSRDYVDLSDLNIFTREIQNDEDLARFYERLEYAAWEFGLPKVEKAS